MVQDKTFIIISKLVDATVKEYQPDVDFRIFRSIDELKDEVEHTPIRAQLLFFTTEVVGGSNTAFSILHGLLDGNEFLQVDKVIYICSPSDATLNSYKYLIEDKGLTNWEYLEGELTRAFVQEVINGTYRDEMTSAKRKVVVRVPRADHVKKQLKNHTTLSEDFASDDIDLAGIESEDLPEIVIDDSPATLHYIYIAGKPIRERSAFALLAAQYVSKSHRTLIIESDPEYHTITEFVTKSKIDATCLEITEGYNNLSHYIDVIRETTTNLVVLTCIDRIPFDYRFLHTMLYYNLEKDFDYIVVESPVEDVPENTQLVVVLPSTITGLLSGCSTIDKGRIPYCNFVGVDLNDLPETHVSSGVVMSTILSDILTTSNIVCPVVTINSLKLNGAAYDLGIVLGRSLHT